MSNEWQQADPLVAAANENCDALERRCRSRAAERLHELKLSKNGKLCCPSLPQPSRAAKAPLEVGVLEASLRVAGTAKSRTANGENRSRRRGIAARPFMNRAVSRHRLFRLSH